MTISADSANQEIEQNCHVPEDQYFQELTKKIRIGNTLTEISIWCERLKKGYCRHLKYQLKIQVAYKKYNRHVLTCFYCNIVKIGLFLFFSELVKYDTVILQLENL